MKIIRFIFETIARFFLPISFLIAVCFAPIEMFSGWKEWPRIWREMWGDPF